MYKKRKKIDGWDQFWILSFRTDVNTVVFIQLGVETKKNGETFIRGVLDTI